MIFFIALGIEFQLDELAGWGVRQMRQLLKLEFGKAGRYWHRFLRPKHFTRGAFQLYGYARRSRTYVRFKARRVGHKNPLRLSDKTMRGSSVHRIVATPSSVDVVYPSTQTLNYKTKRSKVNKRKEFETINDHEVRRMTSNMIASIERKLQTAARNGGRFRLRG